MNHVDCQGSQSLNLPEKDLNDDVGYLQFEEEGDEETEEIEWLKEQEKREKEQASKSPPAKPASHDPAIRML